LKAITDTKRYDAITMGLLCVGVVLVVVGFVLAFTIAPLVNGAAVDTPALIGGQVVTNKLLLSQKIFYFHVPVAVTSMIAMAFTAYFGIRFLISRNSKYDLRAKLSTEITLVFVLMTMVSGELWERFEWGIWWTWEPRLTTYFIFMLLVVAYFVLRNAIDDPERRAMVSSVFGIIAFIDVPICFMITRIVPNELHPVVFRTDSGLPPNMLIPFLIAMFGMFALAVGLWRFRLRQQMLALRVEALKKQLED
jgi:heme exporter protein C